MKRQRNKAAKKATRSATSCTKLEEEEKDVKVFLHGTEETTTTTTTTTMSKKNKKNKRDEKAKEEEEEEEADVERENHGDLVVATTTTTTTTAEMMSSMKGWEECPWMNGVVDYEQMSWGSFWLPNWGVEFVGNAYNLLYGDVVWDDDIWDLKAITHVPNS